MVFGIRNAKTRKSKSYKMNLFWCGQIQGPARYTQDCPNIQPIYYIGFDPCSTRPARGQPGPNLCAVRVPTFDNAHRYALQRGALSSLTSSAKGRMFPTGPQVYKGKDFRRPGMCLLFLTYTWNPPRLEHWSAFVGVDPPCITILEGQSEVNSPQLQQSPS